ncbi:MAG TPA: ABC transporter permease [Bryobacteraceae bacterium]
MRLWSELAGRARYLFQRRRFNQELDDEIQFHIETRAAELEQSGLKRVEARFQARREFGKIGQSKETTRRMFGAATLDGILQDLSYGARQLKRSPGFAITAILSLALGIGANTAIFQLLNAVRLRSLPVRDPQQLMEVKIAGDARFGTHNSWDSLTYPLWEQIRDHQESFSGVFAWSFGDLSFGEGDSARTVRIAWVSGAAFPTLGVRAEKGRLIQAGDDRKNCPAIAVLGYGFWQRQYGGEDSAVGSSLALADPYQPTAASFSVVGVTEPAFAGLEVGRPFDLALPFCAKQRLFRADGEDSLTNRSLFWVGVIGRLKNGVTANQAARQLEASSAPWFEAAAPNDYDATPMGVWRRYRLTAEPRPRGIGQLRENYETPLWLLLGITALVLTIACVNLANLLLARSNARVREYSVRMALGASRARVVSQLFWESLLIALCGAVAGTGLAAVLSRAVVRVVSMQMEGVQLDLGLDWRAGLDWRVIAFIAGVAIAASVSFGLSTALYATRANAMRGANGGARNTTLDRRRFAFQRILIAGQMAISLVLVIASLLFVRSFHNLLSIDPGFRQQGLNFFFVDFVRAGLPKDGMRPFANSLLDQVRAVPGVESAALSTFLPLAGGNWMLLIHVPGHEEAPGEDAACQFAWVSPGYFATLGIPLTAGRDFQESDSAGAPRALIVNQDFVQKYFKKYENPIGRTVRSLREPNYPDTLYEIVGVVKSARHSNLRDAHEPVAYAPDLQHPNIYPTGTIAVRSTMPLASLSKSIGGTLRKIPGVRVNATLNLRERVLTGLSRERLLAWLSGFFGVLALVLATIGLYGVVSYMVSARRKEIGIRIALGATQSAVVSMILRHTAFLLLGGLLAGAALSFALSKSIANLLYGLAPDDPLSFGAAAFVLVAIGLAASGIPARKSAQLDPNVTLREE